MYLPLSGCDALHQNWLGKYGAGEAAADRSQGFHSELGVICFRTPLTKSDKIRPDHTRSDKTVEK